MATKVIKTITVDLLTTDTVSIITKKFATVEGQKQQVGEIERKAYSNSALGRQALIDEVGKPYVSAVFAVWGDEPTLKDPDESEVK